VFSFYSTNNTHDYKFVGFIVAFAIMESSCSFVMYPGLQAYKTIRSAKIQPTQQRFFKK